MKGRRSDRASDVLTVMMIPGQTGNVRRFSVRRRALLVATWTAAAGAVLVAALAIDYVRVRLHMSEYELLQARSAVLTEHLEAYATRIGDISEHLAKIGRFDQKLRIIANLDPADPLPLPGIGGVDGELVGSHQLAGLGRERRHQRMLEGLDQLTDAARAEEDSLSDLIAHLESQTARLAATPSITPTKGWLTSGFGYRTSPFTRRREFHRGIDIAGRAGTPIVAPAAGRVRFAGKRRALGNTVVIRHGYGLETIYGHLSELLVRAGDPVKRGQPLAKMGNTGRSTGPHLHYQVEVNGSPVNPKNYVLD